MLHYMIEGSSNNQEKQIVEGEPTAQMGWILVLTGPSGAGKDTIADGLSNDSDLKLNRIVTYTSRVPRPGEVNGVDYNFVTADTFEQMIKDNEFAEYVEYGSSYKGTPRSPFYNVLHHNRNLLWRIDPSRAAEISEFYDSNFSAEEACALLERTIVMYLGIERLTQLFERVRSRSGEDFTGQRGEFKKRLREDWNIWEKYCDIFQANILMNSGSIDETIAEAKQRILERFS